MKLDCSSLCEAELATAKCGDLWQQIGWAAENLNAVCTPTWMIALRIGSDVAAVSRMKHERRSSIVL